MKGGEGMAGLLLAWVGVGAASPYCRPLTPLLTPCSPTPPPLLQPHTTPREQVSYYPVRACAVSNNAATCGRGFNAWKTYEQCCARQRGALGAFPEGCSNTQAQVCRVCGGEVGTLGREREWCPSGDGGTGRPAVPLHLPHSTLHTSLDPPHPNHPLTHL